MAKRRVLSKADVVQKASDLANQTGYFEQITLKQVADALEVKVPSLYNHVKGSRGLAQAVRESALQNLLDAMRRAAFGKVGDEALFAAASAYRQFAIQNPGTYPLTQRAPRPEERDAARLAQELVQFVALLLPVRQLDSDAQIHAIRGFRALLHGFVMLETTEGFALPTPVQASYERLIHVYLAGLRVGL